MRYGSTVSSMMYVWDGSDCLLPVKNIALVTSSSSIAATHPEHRW